MLGTRLILRRWNGYFRTAESERRSRPMILETVAFSTDWPSFYEDNQVVICFYFSY
jgi:hypothetical protein